MFSSDASDEFALTESIISDPEVILLAAYDDVVAN
jgi:hypothetical protein